MTKPAFLGFLPSYSGELWVVREGPSEPIEDCDPDEVVEIPELGTTRRQRCFRSRFIMDVFAVEYQVLAMSGNGDALWALRVAWPRPPFPNSVKQAMLERAQRGQESISIDAIGWPEEYSAVASLRTDGAGRLYVFPEIPSDGDEPPTTRPVDVYSPTGELLAAGFAPVAWSYAAGDYVYGLRADELDERIVVRYRLVLPGEEQ